MCILNYVPLAKLNEISDQLKWWGKSTAKSKIIIKEKIISYFSFAFPHCYWAGTHGQDSLAFS